MQSMDDRNEIQKGALSFWKQKSNKNIDVASYGVLYQYYDSLLDNKISSKVNSSFNGVFFSTGSFINSTFSGKAGRICGISWTSQPVKTNRKINLKISERVIASISLKYKNDDDEYYYCIIEAFEHQLCHLLILLWGENEGGIDYVKSVPRHGLDFYTLLQEIFSISKDTDIYSVLRDPSFYTTSTLFDEVGLYKYNDNSCHLDSILIILLFSKGGVYRNKIFTTDFDYEAYGFTEKDVKLSCDTKTEMSVESFTDIAEKVQTTILENYSQFINGKSARCVEIRKVIDKCVSMKAENGTWAMFSAPSTYEYLASIFTQLKIKDYVMANNEGDKRKGDISSSISLGDYLFEPEYGYGVVWDTFNDDVLVIRNSSNSRVKDFGRISKSKGNVRMMSERILTSAKNPKGYELVAILTLVGVTSKASMGEESGIHYVAFIKTDDDEWYYYDDSKTVVRKVGPKLEKDFFMDGVKQVKYELYFYIKSIS